MGRNFSPARNVLSITAPSVVRLSLVRTNAGPLPGFTCWKSTILKIVPSTSMCVPFLNWLVEIIGCQSSYVRMIAPRGVKVVTEADADQVIELFTLAFYDDPTWRGAFPAPDRRREQHRAWWGLYVRAALAHES